MHALCQGTAVTITSRGAATGDYGLHEQCVLLSCRVHIHHSCQDWLSTTLRLRPCQFLMVFRLASVTAGLSSIIHSISLLQL
jgi:hypothetical protein